jgi:hypothetical protein
MSGIVEGPCNPSLGPCLGDPLHLWGCPVIPHLPILVHSGVPELNAVENDGMHFRWVRVLRKFRTRTVCYYLSIDSSVETETLYDAQEVRMRSRC